MAEAGRLRFIIEIDDKGTPVVKTLNGEIQHLEKETTGATSKMSSGFGKMWAQMALGQAAFALVQKGFRMVTGAIGDSVKMAIDAEETHSKFGTVFQDVSTQAAAAAKELSDSWGVSKLASETMLSATGDLLTGLGLTGEAALGLSSQTQKLAIDLASFTNFSGGASGASEALTKAMLGERESIKALGIVVTEEMVKEELLRVGKEKLTGMALLQAKAEATLQIAMQQSKNAMGDYERTQDSTANSIKRMQATFEDMKVEIGSAIVETINPALKDMKKWFEENKEAVIEGAKKIIESIAGIVSGVYSLIKAIDAAVPKFMNLTTIAKGWSLIGELMHEIATSGTNAWDSMRANIENIKAAQEQEIELTLKALELKGATIKQMDEWRIAANLDFEQAKKLLYQSELGIGLQEQYNKIHKEAAKEMAARGTVIKDYTFWLSKESSGFDITKNSATGYNSVLSNTTTVIKALGTAHTRTAEQEKAHQAALKELAKEQAEAAKITEKYGLNIKDFNEYGREMYFQLLQIVGIIPEFTKDTQAAAEEQAKLAMGLLRITGLLPNTSTEVNKTSEAEKEAAIGAADFAAAMALTIKVANQIVPGLGDVYEAFKTASASIKAGTFDLTGFLTAGMAVIGGLEQMFGGNMYEIRAKELDATVAAIEAAGLAAKHAATAVGQMESAVEKLTSAEKAGIGGTKDLIAIIEKYGKTSKEVMEYVKQQLQTGFEGYKKMKEALKENVDLQEIFGGINIQVYEDMLNYQNKIAANPALINAIDGATAALIGLSNTTKLTEGQYDQFEQTASSAYDKLIAQGFTSKEALQSLAPMLARLRMLHEEYGLTIDDATQKLLDEAEAQGVNTEQAMGQEEANQRIVESLERLVEIFGGVLPDAIDQTSRAFDGLADSAGRVQYPDSYGGGKHGGDMPEVYAASGFYSPKLSQDTLIQAHAGERVSITPAAQNSGGGRTTYLTIEIKGPGVTPEAVADASREAYDNNTHGFRSMMEN